MVNGSPLGWLEARVEELETERGAIARELGEIRGELRGITATQERILDALEERPSAADVVRLEAGLASVRARARQPSLSELEFKGPAWLGAVRLSGFSGVTIFAVILTGLAGIVAWLVLK